MLLKVFLTTLAIILNCLFTAIILQINTIIPNKFLIFILWFIILQGTLAQTAQILFSLSY